MYLNIRKKAGVYLFLRRLWIPVVGIALYLVGCLPAVDYMINTMVEESILKECGDPYNTVIGGVCGLGIGLASAFFYTYFVGLPLILILAFVFLIGFYQSTFKFLFKDSNLELAVLAYLQRDPHRLQVLKLTTAKRVREFRVSTWKRQLGAQQQYEQQALDDLPEQLRAQLVEAFEKRRQPLLVKIQQYTDCIQAIEAKLDAIECARSDACERALSAHDRGLFQLIGKYEQSSDPLVQGALLPELDGLIYGLKPTN